MRALRFSTLIVAFALAGVAAAQTADTYVVNQPGAVGAGQMVTLTGTIKSIDKDSRSVTVVGEQGKEITVQAGPEVKNFAQLGVGDRVDVSYAQAILVELKKGGGAVVARTENSGMTSAAPGTAPGAMAGRQVKIVGDVTKTDAATQSITVRGPQRTIDVKIRDPEQFKLIAVGDQLEATYFEAAAVDVTPAKAK